MAAHHNVVNLGQWCSHASPASCCCRVRFGIVRHTLVETTIPEQKRRMARFRCVSCVFWRVGQLLCSLVSRPGMIWKTKAAWGTCRRCTPGGVQATFQAGPISFGGLAADVSRLLGWIPRRVPAQAAHLRHDLRDCDLSTTFPLLLLGSLLITQGEGEGGTWSLCPPSCDHITKNQQQPNPNDHSSDDIPRIPRVRSHHEKVRVSLGISLCASCVCWCEAALLSYALLLLRLQGLGPDLREVDLCTVVAGAGRPIS